MESIIVRSLIVCGTILLIGAMPAAAQSDPHPTWPDQGEEYACDTNCRISFTNLNGNNYLRRGTLNTVCDGGWEAHNQVTVTKPVSCAHNCTVFEITVEDTTPKIQCQDFRVRIAASWPPGTSMHMANFTDCSNGVVQRCFRRARP